MASSHQKASYGLKANTWITSLGASLTITDKW